jgi:hypothetical protein
MSLRREAKGVVPAATRGYDCWKKVDGRQRHLMTDTLGLLVVVTVSAVAGLTRQAL